MSDVAKSNIFSCAKLEFKIASGLGKHPAEGVAVLIRMEDNSTVILQSSNRNGNAISQIQDIIQPSIGLSKKFTVEAIAFATEITTGEQDTLDPTPEALEVLPLLFVGQTETPPIFIVDGHGMDDHTIREYVLAPK